MHIKYNRTSTIKQDGKRFQSDKYNYDGEYFDRGVSGTVPFAKRHHGAEIMAEVEQGNITEITFEDLSRVGRTLKDTINTLDWFIQKGVRLNIREQGLKSHHPNGTKNPIWKLMIGVLGAVYEMERERILEITRAGRQAYIDRGGKLGKPQGVRESKEKFLSKPKNRQIKRLLKQGKSYQDISSRLKCSHNTIAKVKKLMS